MKKYVLILLVLLIEACVVNTQASGFFSYNTQEQIIDGQKYPRIGQVKYRGTFTYQLTEEEAVRAFFGDQLVNIESRFFVTLKTKLMGQTFSHAVELSSYLNKQISEAVEKKGSFLSEEESVKKAIELSDSTFDYYESKDWIKERYLNYNSGEYIDWPTDVVFTTLISPAAATYGERVLVFKEKEESSVDLNYWNFLQNKTWYSHTRDVDEFINFSFIPGEDLKSYEIRKGTDKSWHSIDYALTKVQGQSHNYVLLLDGKLNGSNITCLNYDLAQVRVCNYQPGTIALSAPQANDTSPLLIGIFHSCNGNPRCLTGLSKIQNSYSPSTRLNSSPLILKKTEIMGKPLSFDPYN